MIYLRNHCKKVYVYIDGCINIRIVLLPNIGIGPKNCISVGLSSLRFQRFYLEMFFAQFTSMLPSCRICTSTELHKQFGLSLPCILYSLLVYKPFFRLFFFFFLSIISRPKSFFFKQTKNKEKQTSATPVCVFSFRGQTFSAVGNQSRGKCAASLEEDTQYGW